MNKIFFILGTLVMFLFASCATQKITYVKDMKVNEAYQINAIEPLKVQKGDRLSIIVSARTPELAAPFNDALGAYRVTPTGEISSTNQQSSLVEKGYLVNSDGEIEFPIFGRIPVEGLQLNQIRDIISQKLTDQKLISSPAVKVELLNMKINIMGEVKGARIINVPDGRLTLLEALNTAGGLTNNALTDSVSVIREENGIRTMYTTDIQSKEFFNSPIYYLKQNDIVYVKPKDKTQTVKSESTWRWVTFATGMVSLIVGVLNLTR